jgi:hypothetical protein
MASWEDIRKDAMRHDLRPLSFGRSLHHGNRKMGIVTLLIGRIASCLRVSLALAAGFVLAAVNIEKAGARELVNWDGGHELGTIVVNTSER